MSTSREELRLKHIQDLDFKLKNIAIDEVIKMVANGFDDVDIGAMMSTFLINGLTDHMMVIGSSSPADINESQ